MQSFQFLGSAESSLRNIFAHVFDLLMMDRLTLAKGDLDCDLFLRKD